ncbi:MAG: hypothetical protein ACK54R_06915, partial [Pirellulaceae bacterium]
LYSIWTKTDRSKDVLDDRIFLCLLDLPAGSIAISAPSARQAGTVAAIPTSRCRNILMYIRIL